METAKNLTGVFHGVHDIRVDESTKPEVSDNGVVIKVIKAGICGSDIHFYHTPMVPVGSVLGHEFTGVIEAVGGDVADLSAGMRVLVNPMISGVGLGIKPGGFANYVHMENAQKGVNIIPIPDQITKEQGALIEPLTVGYAGVALAEVTEDSNVIVFGTGTIGLAVIASLAAKGVKTIIASDISEKRLAMAKALGATLTYNPATAAKSLNEFLTEELGSTTSLFGVKNPNLDVALECSGVPAVFLDGLQNLGAQGKMIILATYPKDIEINVSYLILAKALTVKGSFAYTSAQMQEVVDLVAAGKIDLTPIVTHEFPLTELPEAFAVQADSKQSVKVLVDIG